MGGVLTHAILGIISGIVLYKIWKKPEFFFAALVGNTIVDFFKFFFAAIEQLTLSLFFVEQNSTFWFFANLTNNAANWFTLGFFLITLITFLYHHHIIRKKTFFEYDELIWAFLIGVSLHLLLDFFILKEVLGFNFLKHIFINKL